MIDDDRPQQQQYNNNTRVQQRHRNTHLNNPKSTMKFSVSFLALAFLAQTAVASVFLPYTATVSDPRAFYATAAARRQTQQKTDLRRLLRQNRASPATAMAIPGNGIAEQVVVGGFLNFLSIYNLVITGRILLSWFPQAQGVAALQPVYAITDPYLNLFRGLIPPVFGLDLSPLLAFFLLSVMTNATVALGCDMTPEQLHKLRRQQQQHKKKNQFKNAKSTAAFLTQRLLANRVPGSVSMNL